MGGISDKNKKEEKILVYDLGGGTFDVSILELDEGTFEVLSTSGNNKLGGDDFDELIVKYILEKFNAENGFDLSADKLAMQRVKEMAEKVKKDLSGVLEETIKTVREALKAAKLEPKDLNEILLVGGSTRIPAVKLMMEKELGKQVNTSINPDEVVSLGAAIQGGVLTGTVKDVLLLDVTPLTLGLETMGEVMTPLIEKNTTIPTSKTQIFSTALDNQPQVDINILQGERALVKDNKSLGRFMLDGIEPAPRGVPQIEVTFSINADGIVSVVAKDKKTDKERKITITDAGSVSEEEIERMVKEAYANKE